MLGDIKWNPPVSTSMIADHPIGLVCSLPSSNDL